MARKIDIKKCRYPYCKHKSKEIDISVEEYKTKGNMYFHPDCYKAKIEGEWKDEKTKADLQYIKNLWIENISNTVVFSQLYHCLNELLQRGIESEYLVFVMQYCVSTGMNLNHPQGFKYFVDNNYIKSAYQKIQLKKNRVKPEVFSVTETDDSPKFSFKTSPATKGFGSILGGK